MSEHELQATIERGEDDQRRISPPHAEDHIDYPTGNHVAERAHDDSVNHSSASDGHNAASQSSSGAQGISEDDYDKSITKDVIYEIKEKPEFTETRALIIANLTSPFDNKDFQELLNDHAAKTNSTIERAWLNARRTHCIVIVSDIAGAVSIQQNLNGKWFPHVDAVEEPQPEFDENGEEIKRHRLYIDFIPVKATQHWIDQENKGPKDAIWNVSYTKLPSKQHQGSEFLVATHKMLNYPNKTFGYKSSSHGGRYRGGAGRSSGGYRGAGRGRGHRDYYGNYPPYGGGYGNGSYGGDYSGPDSRGSGYYGRPDYDYRDYAPDSDPYYNDRYGPPGGPSAGPGGYYGGPGGPSAPDGPGGYYGGGGRRRRGRGRYRDGPAPGYESGYRSSGAGPGSTDGGAGSGGAGDLSGGAGGDDQYRRDRSPVRSNGHRSYGSRSPPRQTRSPEWSD